MGRKSSALPGVRWEEIVKPGRTARRRPRVRGLRTGLKVLGYAGVVLLVLAILGGGLYAYVQLKLRANSRNIPALAEKKPRDAMNVLVLGSDSRAVLPEEEQGQFDPTGQDRKSGQRADTIVLVHLDEDREQVVVLHFPRDLRIKYPNGTFGKINGLYRLGPDPMVKTIEQFTGLPIHHYVEVNFVGFRNVVNALGGVEVYFEKPIKEDDSGLDVPSGCVRLEGDQALAFVRVRKIDDDFGRIGRQQLFVRLMMERISSAKTFLNPIKVVQLVNLFARNVTTDADLSLSEMKTMALRLRTFDPSRVDMRVVPSAPARVGRVSFVVANEKQTSELLGAIRERRPLPDYGRTGVSSIDPADVRVEVLNGTPVSGLGARAAEDVKAKGFPVSGKPSNADRSDYEETTVYYKEGNEEKARTVAGHYGAEVKPVPGAIVPTGEVVLVVGKDYAEGRATPSPLSPPGKAAPKPPIRPCD